MSPANIEEAWTDPGGEILLRYESGVEVIYNPDAGTPEEDIAASQDMIAEGWPGTLVPLRGTQALAADIDPQGPAVVSWVEGPYEVNLYGDGGQTLAELIELAESLPGFEG